jgi:hypothetical protein
MCSEVVVNIRKYFEKVSEDAVLVTFADLDDMLDEGAGIITIDDLFEYYNLEDYIIDTIEDLNILVEFIREYYEYNINLDYNEQIQTF